MGAWVLRFGDRHALASGVPPAPAVQRTPLDPAARTAVIMPICNEDIATVFAGLSATCESVAATGALPLFDFYVLSDTSKPELRAAELAAWKHLRRTLGDDAPGAGARVFYRWRRRRTRKKAGNVADFCRRWGARYRYMVVLDADSTMAGETLVSMVRLMEANPQAGIVQTLPQAAGAHTLHARLQQFASRVSGRLFALGMAYWQLGESHYWGHNAILRVAPFMQHCALAPLPGRGGLSGDILSHDFVEAALMRRAGYEVWLAPQLQGSWEQHPPHLIDELQRDRRWCQGNLQNARLIAEPGLAGAHRAMLAVGAFSYLVAPLWLLFVVSGLLLEVPVDDAAGALPNAGLWVLTLVLLLLPRALGVASICWAGLQAPFGGSARLLAGAAFELLVSALQAPVRMLAHTVFVLGALSGFKLAWKSPLRDASAVRFAEAFRRVGALVALPLAAVLALTALTSFDMAQAMPMLLPLLLAVPLAWAAAHPRFGLRLLRAGWLSVPEERQPPKALRRSSDPGVYQRLQAEFPRAGQAVAALRAVPAGGWSALRVVLLAGVAAAFVVGAMQPRVAYAPGFPDWVQAEWSRKLESSKPATAAPPVVVAEARPRKARTYRPASTIDDAVRRRAAESVRRALAEEGQALPAEEWQSPAT
jgi:membrane glycosyltransferase